MRISMKSARVNANLTQAEIAEKLGITSVCYWYWESGRISMTERKFKEFCDIVGATEEDIFLPCELRETKRRKEKERGASN